MRDVDALQGHGRALAAETGQVLLDGKPASFRRPLDVRRGGIAAVSQELPLIPTLSETENIVLGTEPLGRLAKVDQIALRARAEGLIASVGALAAGLDPDALDGDLPIDLQQIVEILKALVMAPRMILFDETSSSLDRSQAAAFFAPLRRLQSGKVSTLLISHRMEEIFGSADRVTVMRNGTRVDTRMTPETTRDDLVSLMVGGRQEPGVRIRINDIMMGWAASPAVAGMLAETLVKGADRAAAVAEGRPLKRVLTVEEVARLDVDLLSEADQGAIVPPLRLAFRSGENTAPRHPLHQSRPR